MAQQAVDPAGPALERLLNQLAEASEQAPAGQERKVDNTELRNPNIDQTELYRIINNAFPNAGADAATGRPAINAAWKRQQAQPIPNDDRANLDKYIIRLNNYIRSITNPGQYLQTKLKALVDVRSYVRELKQYYIHKFLRMGYSEREATAMAEALVEPIKSAEVKLLEEQLPDKMTELAGQISRYSYAPDAGTALGQRMLDLKR